MKTLYKNILIFTLLLFVFTNIKAQENPWSVSAFYTPSLNNELTQVKQDSSYNHSIKESYDSTTLFSYGFSTGINIAYRINNFEILTGIEYGIQNQKTYNKSNSVHNFSMLTDVEIIGYAKKRFFSIPLYLKYHLLNKKFGMYCTVGARYSYLSHIHSGNAYVEYYHAGTNNLIKKDKFEGEWEKLSSNHYQRKDHFYAMLGIGTSFKISESISTFVEPNFSISLNNMYKTFPTAAIAIHPYSFGLKTGIAWHF